MGLRGSWVAAVAVALGVVAPAAHAASHAPRVEVVSSRPNLISGGEAVVKVTLPRGARTARLKVKLGKRDVTRSFHSLGQGVLEALVTRIPNRRVELKATYRGRTRTLTLVGHPNGGPLFAGPQVQPWGCQKGAVDKQCNQPARFGYLYHSTDPTKPELVPYDPARPPRDVATTTTEQGKKVPFIVRQEIGYQDRDMYEILTLFDPHQPWTRWKPQSTWNRKLLIPGGGGCLGEYHTGIPPLADFSGTIPQIPFYPSSYVNSLGRGFAVLSTALENTGHNCNLVVEAESLIMAKAHFIARYGDVRYTIGTGCSGGSSVQMTVANAYPGAVYDGLVLTCSFPDVITGGAQFGDYHLMLDYFNNTAGWGPGVVWLPTQMAAVEGQGLPISAIVADVALFKVAISPIGTCVAPAYAYNPQTNPGGVRCDVLDYMLNVLGPRPRSVWTPPEVAAGRGFAGFPFGNIGIQYGLDALRSGQITADQFVDLNAKVGGIDINGQHSAERLRGDDASIANAYRSGLVNEADNLSDVAILNYAGPDPGLAHDTAHAWWIRDRLDAAQGNHDNNVIWYGNFPLIGDPAWPTSAILAMDRWLSAVHADGSDKPLAQKIAKDRPADIHDRCELLPGLSDYPATDVCLPPALQTRFSTPRGVAGGGPLNDVLKCRLRPPARSDYGTPGLTDAQWARVKQIFPTGVCDWSKPGVGQQRNIPWMTYQDSHGRVVYGGRPMGR